MQPDDTLRLKSQFQMEKQVFPDSVHAMRTYRNKRKSCSDWSKRISKRLSLRSPTENDLPLTEMDPKKRSTQIVEQWMQSCSADISLSNRERTPFTDLDPNRLSYLTAEQKETSSKMFLRSSATKNKRENSLSEYSTQSFRSKSFSLVKGEVSQSTPNNNSIIIEKKSRNKTKKETKKPYTKKYMEKVKNGSEEKSRMKAKKAITNTDSTKKSAKAMEGENEVISIGESNSSHLESPIVIEDSQERYVDKDRLACLAVLRAEELRQMELLGGDGDIQFDPPEVDAISSLKGNIDSLRDELSQLEALRKTPSVPSHNKHGMILWSSQALLDILKDDDKTRMKCMGKTVARSPLKTTIKQRKRIIQNKSLLKNKVQCLKTANINKLLNRNKIINLISGKRCSKKTYSKSVQTDLPCPTCTCNNVAPEEKSTTTNLREQPVETGGLGEDIYEICEADEDISKYIEKESTMNRTTDERSQSGLKFEVQNDMISLRLETGDIDISDTESAHNASGDHIVKVLVHAEIPSPEHVDSDNSIIGDTPENTGVFRTLQNIDHSPSAMWEDRHRTPPRQAPAVSPTYTSPMSSSSSNKENHDPNDTPLKDTKKPEKKKDACKSIAHRPLALLFEAPPARVYVACSCLRPVQESVVMLLCKQLGWVYCQEYIAEITHLVVAVDNDNRTQRSVKYMCALASGCWVVSYEWAMQSLKQDCHLEEESFEVLDSSGGSGPRLSRTASAKLFCSLTFCCLPTVTSIRPDILTWIVEAAGARTVEPAALQAARAGPVVVLHERKEEENAQFYKEAVSGWRVQTAALSYEWVLECLGHYRLLCPDVYLLQPRGGGAERERTLAWLYELCSATPRITI